MNSYTIEYAKKIFVLVTPRGSFARSMWGDTWTRSIDEAQIAHGEDEAEKAAKKINDRLGKKEVRPEPIAKHMKLCWGFSFLGGDNVQCVQKYFPVNMEAISDLPNPNPDAQRYAYPKDKAFADPQLAWLHLRAKRLHDLEYARKSLDEINGELSACEKHLNPDGKQPENVVAINKRGDGT